MRQYNSNAVSQSAQSSQFKKPTQTSGGNEELLHEIETLKQYIMRSKIKNGAGNKILETKQVDTQLVMSSLESAVNSINKNQINIFIFFRLI